MRSLPDLICPAGSLPALKAAVDNGADAVYLGFRNDTNARNFAGLNFDPKSMADGIRYAHGKGRDILIAINTFPQAGRVAEWQKAVDAAVDQGADAIILADIGLLDYAARRHPQQRLHLSVQGSATSYEAINFCQREFGIRRAVLPRVLTLAQAPPLPAWVLPAAICSKLVVEVVESATLTPFTTAAALPLLHQKQRSPPRLE